MLVAVDTNILMEILERRSRFEKVRSHIAGYDQPQTSLAISTLSISNIFYLAEAHKIPYAKVENLINAFKILDVTSEDVAWALKNYKEKDFEDALQLAASLRENCERFLTLDVALAKKYSGYLEIELIR